MSRKANHEDIGAKSVWDLYIENFRDHIWDLAPRFRLNPFRVLNAEEESKEKAEEKKRIKKAKNKSKYLTRPPFKIKKKSGEKDS